MKAILTLGALTVISVSLFPPILYAEYAKSICNNAELYDCYKVKKGETWESMFPEPENRTYVKKINRMNIQVRPGLIIAVPKDKSIDS
ncbi:MAG TPA: L,D-transpeptidase, partial [Candidatus Berkiella sp.]|nr:L,D-transpeptidase [Candidatus Berkiella sp.]